MPMTHFPALERAVADMTVRDRYITALALERSLTPMLRALAFDLHEANYAAEAERAALETQLTDPHTPDEGTQP